LIDLYNPLHKSVVVRRLSCRYSILLLALTNDVRVSVLCRELGSLWKGSVACHALIDPNRGKKRPVRFM